MKHTSKRETRTRAVRTAPERPPLALLAGALWVAFDICILGPHQIHATNPAEFESSFREVLPWLAGACVCVMTILVAIGMLVPRSKGATYATILMAVGLLLWIQGSFLKWDYGDFSGTNIDWKLYPWQGWLDAGVWIALVVVLLRFRNLVARYASFPVLAFVVVQTALLWAGTSSDATQPSTDDPPAVPVESCRISRNLNVFHVILDSFQTDVFLELVKEENLANRLNGFVLYRENAAPASQTVLCIPAIFTGQYYDGTVLPSEFYRWATREGFHNQLATLGYVVNLIPYIEMVIAQFSTHYMSPRTYAWPRRTRIMQDSSYLIDVGMFRQSPHFLKRAIYNSRNWRLSSLIATPPNHLSFHQKAFFRDYIDKLIVFHDAPAYNFVHLSPPHPPYVTTREGHYAGQALPDTRDNFKNEARHVLRLFVDFLDKLKTLEAYDRSIIVLQGDHGSSFAPILDGQEYPMIVNRIPALLTLKEAGAHGALRVRDAPTTAADVAATILDLVDIEHSLGGRSIVQMPENAVRNRTYGMLDERPNGGSILRRWTIDGSIYDQSSFHELEPHEIRSRIREYDWGTRLSFGVAGTGEGYLASGWWASGAMHWSSAKESKMHFRITPPSEDVVLDFIFFFYFVSGRVEQQRVRMRVNGVSIGGEQVSRDARPKGIRFVVPQGLLQSGVMRIDFEFPDAAPLDQNGKSDVMRAVALWSFRADLVSAVPDAIRNPGGP